MVKYYGRAKTRTGSVNTNQIGLKMSGCPSKIGRQGYLSKHIAKRSICNLKFCGIVPYSGPGLIYSINRNRCVKRAPRGQSFNAGVGNKANPRFACNKNCSINKINNFYDTLTAVRILQAYLKDKYNGEGSLILVAPNETLKSDGVFCDNCDKIQHFDPRHPEYFMLPLRVQAAADVINNLGITAPLVIDGPEIPHIAGYESFIGQQALQNAGYGFIRKFGPEERDSVLVFGVNFDISYLQFLTPHEGDYDNSGLEREAPLEEMEEEYSSDNSCSGLLDTIITVENKDGKVGYIENVMGLLSVEAFPHLANSSISRIHAEDSFLFIGVTAPPNFSIESPNLAEAVRDGTPMFLKSISFTFCNDEEKSISYGHNTSRPHRISYSYTSNTILWAVEAFGDVEHSEFWEAVADEQEIGVVLTPYDAITIGVKHEAVVGLNKDIQKFELHNEQLFNLSFDHHTLSLARDGEQFQRMGTVIKDQTNPLYRSDQRPYFFPNTDANGLSWVFIKVSTQETTGVNSQLGQRLVRAADNEKEYKFYRWNSGVEKEGTWIVFLIQFIGNKYKVVSNLFQVQF